jgi:HAD superfamily hydrolase (TIGR01549 family)
MTPDQERYVHSHTIAQSLARILPAGSKEQAEEVRSKIDYSDLLSFVRVQPGLEFVLQLLKQRGVRLAVNTNRTDTMGLILREFDLERYFFPIVTSSRVTWAKPHPESLNYILDTWTLGPEEVAYIGDSWVDAQTAKSAGVPFWAFGDPSLEADLFVPDFDCLGQVLALKLPRPDNP